VWIGTDREKVQAFYAKYQTSISLGEEMDREAYLKWQGMLRKEKLE